MKENVVYILLESRTKYKNNKKKKSNRYIQGVYDSFKKAYEKQLQHMRSFLFDPYEQDNNLLSNDKYYTYTWEIEERFINV